MLGGRGRVTDVLLSILLRVRHSHSTFAAGSRFSARFKIMATLSTTPSAPLLLPYTCSRNRSQSPLAPPAAAAAAHLLLPRGRLSQLFSALAVLLPLLLCLSPSCFLCLFLSLSLSRSVFLSLSLLI